MSGFVEKIVINSETADITYRKDRLVTANVTETVHSGRNWLPDQSKVRTANVLILLPERFRRAA